MSSGTEDGSSNDNVKQPGRRPDKRNNSRRRQQQEHSHRNRFSQQMIEDSRSDSKSPGDRHQQYYQQSPRETGVRDLFNFSSQLPQMPIQQPRNQMVSRTADAAYDVKQQQFSGGNSYYDEHQHHHHHHQSQQPLQYENYQRDFEPVEFAQSTSPLSFYGPAASPDNSHIRPQQQQQQQRHHFEFGSDGSNFFTPDEDNCRVRFLSSSSSVSSSFSEEPSQVHMMAGCGQSVASSSCMSGSGSYLFDSARKNSNGDLAAFGKAVRCVMHEEDERLCAMGMMSINQNGTTSGKPSPEQQWTAPTFLPRMSTEEFNAGIESEYHDVKDEDIHHQYVPPSSVSSTRRVHLRQEVDEPPKNDRIDNQKESEKKNEFSINSISEWSSSYFR